MGTKFEEQAGQFMVLNAGSRGRESENWFECGHRSRHLWMGCAGQSDHTRTRKGASLMDENGTFMEPS